MEGNKITYKTIDEYILQFPPDVQEILKKVRETIKESALDAEEKISYQMPTFVFHGNLVSGILMEFIWLIHNLRIRKMSLIC